MPVKAVQLEKALWPILTTPSGIDTSSRLEQFEKAASPIIFTPEGISIRVKPVQEVKADAPNSEMPEGIVEIRQPAISVFDAVSMIALH